MQVAISPDGKYVANLTQDAEGNSLWVRPVTATSSVRLAGPAQTQYVSLTFTPDGDSIYFLTLDSGDKGRTALYRVPVLGRPVEPCGLRRRPGRFLPDGRQITFVRKHGDGSSLMVASPGARMNELWRRAGSRSFFRWIGTPPPGAPHGKQSRVR